MRIIAPRNKSLINNIIKYVPVPNKLTANSSMKLNLGLARAKYTSMEETIIMGIIKILR
jgi:hypothetical protein